jgi:hypothetical protein
LTQREFNEWIDGLAVKESVKDQLRTLSPLTYIGLATQLADRTLKNK